MSACANQVPRSRRSIGPGNASASGALNFAGENVKGSPAARLVAIIAYTGCRSKKPPPNLGSLAAFLERNNKTRAVTRLVRTLAGKETTKRKGAFVATVSSFEVLGGSLMGSLVGCTHPAAPSITIKQNRLATRQLPRFRGDSCVMRRA